MSKITDFITSLKAMELPRGAESLLSSISSEATTLEADRDDAVKKIKTRQDETDRQKERAQTAESRVKELEDAAPKEGEVSISRAEADVLKSYQALGKPDELTARLEAGQAAQKTAHAASTRESLRALGYEPTDRLLRDFSDVSLDVKTEKDAQGKELKIGTVKADGKDVAFGDWLKTSGLEGDMARYRSDSRPGSVVVLPQYQGDGNGGSADPTQATRDSAFGI